MMMMEEEEEESQQPKENEEGGEGKEKLKHRMTDYVICEIIIKIKLCACFCSEHGNSLKICRMSVMCCVHTGKPDDKKEKGGDKADDKVRRFYF